MRLLLLGGRIRALIGRCGPTDGDVGGELAMTRGSLNVTQQQLGTWGWSEGDGTPGNRQIAVVADQDLRQTYARH